MKKQAYLIALFLITPLTGLVAQNTFPSTGNVGIGTTSPQQELHVEGQNILLKRSSGTSLHLRVDSNNSFINNMDGFVNNGSFGNGALIITGQAGISLRTGNSGSSGTNRMRILENGNVGIGTTAPNSLLELKGSVISAGTSVLSIDNTFVANSFDFGDNRPFAIRRHASNSEALFMYTLDGATLFTYNNDEATSQIRFRLINNDLGGNGANANDNYVLTLKGDANGGAVGIGTTIPAHKLDVKGTVHAEEVLVDLNVEGPDYVFEEDYLLQDLPSLEQYLKANKHLPEVPSANEMKKEGIKVGEMEMLLLKKVEELTLYIIELEKRVKELEDED